MINKRTKKFLLLLLIVLVLALVIRLLVSSDLYSFNYGHNAVQTPPKTTDMATYMELSQRIANGSYSGELDYQPFYYVVALPIVNFIGGGNLWGVIWFQALLGAITCCLTGLCAAAICGRRGGYIAAGLTMCCGIIICYTPFHLIATLQAFWIVLLFYSALLAFKRGKLRYWSLVGLIAGCAILTRGNIWFFIPGLAVLAIYSGLKGTGRCSKNSKAIESTKGKAKQRTVKPTIVTAIAARRSRLSVKTLLPLLLLLLLMILPQIPFAWYNSVVKGYLSGPSTAAGKVLVLGNTKEAPPGGRNPGYAGPMEYPPSYGLWVNNQATISVPRRIINWFMEQPMAYIELSFRKLLLFWDYREIPNNISYRQVREQSQWLRSLGFISSGFIMVLAIAGLLLWLPRLRHNIQLLLLYYFILAYWCGTAAFYILARFRMPLLPLLAIAAALGIEWVIRHRKAGQRAWLAIVATFILAYFICYQAYDLYRNNLESPIIRLVRPAGVQVKMSPDSYMLLDNGPLSFGGWQMMPLTANLVLNKTFIELPKGEITGMKLELPLVAERAGSVVIAINGKQEFVTFTKAGMKNFTFTLSLVTAGTVKIQFVGGTIPVSVVLDYQRDYARTTINGKPTPAELVCRLFCIVKPRISLQPAI